MYIPKLYSIVEATETSTTLTLPPVDRVEESMISLLPSPQDILTAELLRAHLFPLAFVRDFGTLYSFDDVPEGMSTALELSSRETRKRSIMTDVWFTHFFCCSHDTICASMDT